MIGDLKWIQPVFQTCIKFMSCWNCFDKELYTRYYKLDFYLVSFLSIVLISGLFLFLYLVGLLIPYFYNPPGLKMFDERTIILKFLSYSIETGNRNLQHVLQKCWKRVEWRCCAFYHPHIKPVLQQIRLLQVAWLLTYDWIKLRRSHTIYGSYVTLPKTRLLWAAKCRPTL